MPFNLNNKFRASIDLICVLDISGSMSGKKMKLLKATVTSIVDALQDIDRLAIVTFNHKAQRLTALKKLTPQNKSSIIDQVSQMKAKGETNIAHAMDVAFAILD